ncbi:MAG: hypothetical protein OEX04_20215 [Acidimicrobiia bacterium]|nr:hypothetical protein [Acidimicrobiia bacterium]MDH4309804.1 hypothetical protein [Acidimicrobiia bacterium]MDH5294208.1 hypothetical protein [Acidimicrobiia bacterium]
MATVIAVAVALVVSHAIARAAGFLGPRVGLVDLPDGELKTHARPIPPLGGLGVVAGYLAGGIAARTLGDSDWFTPSTVVAVVAAAGLGLTDDRVSLSPRIRLVAEIAIGATLVAGPLAAGEIGPFVAALGMVAAVVLINAVNLFDGLDGLVSSAALAGLVGLGLFAGSFGGSVGALVAAGAIGGFLPLNWNPARMFLGDNGSYAIGVLLAASMLDTGSMSGVVAAGSVATVFLVDLAATLIRRRRSGVPLFAGDRSHTYDVLGDRGWGVKRLAGTAAVVNLVSVVVAAIVAGWSLTAAAVVAVATVLSLVVIVVITVHR